MKKAPKIIALLLVWLFVLLTGASPSTIRAAIMATFVVFAFILQRKNSSLNSLLAAVFIILLFDPSALYDVGFQFSVTAVAAILLFTDKLNPIDHHNHPRLHTVFSLCLISLVCTIATWVLMAYYFNNVPVLFLPANLFLLPLLPLFLGVGLIYLVLLLFSVDLSLLRSFMDIFYDTFINASFLLSAKGNSSLSLSISEFTVFFWLLAIMAFGVSLHAIKNSSRKIFLFSGTALCAISLVFIFQKEENVSAAIRFPHSFNQLEAIMMDPNNTYRLKFPRNTASSTKLDRCEIISLDCRVKEDSLSLLIPAKEGNKRFLLVGPGAEYNQIASLIKGGGFEKVILHSGFGKKKISSLLENLGKGNQDKVHSLRENGSLEINL